MALLDRLSDKFVVGDGCWEWTAARNQFGYGVIHRLDEGSRLAHRILYEMLVGPIPEGLELDHLCRNRGCVRPSHLEAVTRQVNILRGDNPRIVKARNASKTHCPHGHPYDEQERYRRPNGERRCGACARDYWRRKREMQVAH